MLKHIYISLIILNIANISLIIYSKSKMKIFSNNIKTQQINLKSLNQNINALKSQLSEISIGFESAKNDTSFHYRTTFYLEILGIDLINRTTDGNNKFIQSIYALSMKEKELALQLINEAIELDSDYKKYQHSIKGWIYHDLYKDYKLALNEANSGINLLGDDFFSYSLLAMSNLNLEDTSNVESLFFKSIDLSNNATQSTHIWAKLTQYYLDYRNCQKAKNSLKSVIKHAKNSKFEGSDFIYAIDNFTDRIYEICN